MMDAIDINSLERGGMTMTALQDLTWVYDCDAVDWSEMSELYRVAPLGEKPPKSLTTVFSASRYVCFVYAGESLVAAGRALADGLDCAYIADVAVRPSHQGQGLGKQVIRELVRQASDHRKILLYANPGVEGFYASLGFLPMNTAMAIWSDPEQAIESGLLRRMD